MWFTSKPMSSPGRADKYPPPPLMRLLRSNAGSRSRGRSRASPMFVRKKPNATAVETQEPSSPKVTCMGQVRVSRSKKPARNRSKCRWIRTALSCNPLAGKLRPFRWPKWASFSSYMSFRGRSKSRENSMRSEPDFGTESCSVRDFGNFETEPEKARVSVSTTTTTGALTPPRNALLLTRSRSAPYRSSSLAYRFWGSPLASEEATSETDKPSNRESEDEKGESKSNRESDSDEKPKTDGENERNQPKIGEEIERNEAFCKEIEGPIREKNIGDESGNTERIETEDLGSLKPLILTRCKSEPARVGRSTWWRLDSGRREGSEFFT